MAKDLPYFKFYCSEWNDGDITLEDYHVQGVFINVCSYYWSKECVLTAKNLNKRFKSDLETIETLFEEGFIKDVDGVISITFLDEQLEERGKSSNAKSIAGKKSAELKKLRKEINVLLADFSIEFNEDLAKLKQQFNTKSTDVEFLLQHISTIKKRREEKRKEKKREEENKPTIDINEIEVVDALTIDSYYPLEILKVNYLQNEKVINAVLENNKGVFNNRAELECKLEEFISNLIQTSETIKTPKDFASHFRNWFLKNKGKTISNGQRAFKPSNPLNEKMIRFTSNVNGTPQELPESKFYEMKERNAAGGYEYKIVG